MTQGSLIDPNRSAEIHKYGMHSLILMSKKWAKVDEENFEKKKFSQLSLTVSYISNVQKLHP